MEGWKARVGVVMGLIVVVMKGRNVAGGGGGGGRVSGMWWGDCVELKKVEHDLVCGRMEIPDVDGRWKSWWMVDGIDGGV